MAHPSGRERRPRSRSGQVEDDGRDRRDSRQPQLRCPRDRLRRHEVTCSNIRRQEIEHTTGCKAGADCVIYSEWLGAFGLTPVPAGEKK